MKSACVLILGAIFLAFATGCTFHRPAFAGKSDTTQRIFSPDGAASFIIPQGWTLEYLHAHGFRVDSDDGAYVESDEYHDIAGSQEAFDRERLTSPQAIYIPYEADPAKAYAGIERACGCGEVHVDGEYPIARPSRIAPEISGPGTNTNREITGSISSHGSASDFDIFVVETPRRPDGSWTFKFLFEMNAPSEIFTRDLPLMKSIKDSACGIDAPYDEGSCRSIAAAASV